MPESRRLQVLTAVKARLAAITVAGGFATNAGQRVYHGAPHTLDDGQPFIVLSTPELAEYEEAAVNHRHVQMLVQVDAAITPADAANPLVTAEALLADLEQALFTSDRTLGGLAKNVVSHQATTLDRPDGGSLVGARVLFRVLYSDKYGDPYGVPA